MRRGEGVGGTLYLTHPSGLGATLVLPRLLAHPRCSDSCCLTHGLCPSSLCRLLEGGCLHALGVGSRPSHRGESPSATRFVPPKLPFLALGLRPAILCGAPLHPSRTKPKLWGPGWAAPRDLGVVTWSGSGQTQSQARTGCGPRLPCRVLTELRGVSLEIVNSFAEKINV